MPKITVRIVKGAATISTEGFQGDACLAATAKLAARLGGKVISDTPTPEMYEAPPTTGNEESQS